jgi:hypothetical protein
MSLGPVHGAREDDSTSRGSRGDELTYLVAANARDAGGCSGAPGGTDYGQEEILDMILASRIGQDREPPPEDEEEPPDWDDWDPASASGIGPGVGFASNGPLDALTPGPALAGLVDDTYGDGLNRLDDDQLVGFMGACRRMTSRFAAEELAAVAELARRRPAEANDTAFGRRIKARLGQAGEPSRGVDGTPPAASGEAVGAGTPGEPVGAGARGEAPRQAEGGLPPLISPFVPDELAAALTLTVRAAEAHLELALALADRLPKTAAALENGVIDLVRAKIIADATCVLSDEHAAAVEEWILPRAGQQTSGKLRAAVASAVLAADPEAARKRQEKARQDARVMRWREDAGTAALCGRDLPSADVLAADQRITAHALELKSAGLAGTMDELRARAYLDFLLGRSSIPVAPEPEPATTSGSPTSEPARRRSAAAAPSGSGPDASSDPPAGSGAPPPAPEPGASAPAGDQPPLPAGLAARINLIVPLSALFGASDVPGEVTAFGPVDAETARGLAAAAGTHPATRWCVTVVDEDGRPVGHGCSRGRHTAPPGPPLPDGSDPWGGCHGDGDHRGDGRSRTKTRDGPSGSRPDPDRPEHRPGGPEAGRSQPGLTRHERTLELMRRFGITVTPLAVGTCDHRNEEPGYEPSRRLRHLVEARTPTCSFPGCRRQASRCDHDHTIPYEAGGRTCECNLAPLCRRHHRCKQSQGWTLEQPSPGILTWTTPAGRRYATTPAHYDA